jgi:hypothetical protein
MFARCVFRSGTIPKVIRSDRRVEFKNTLMQEFTALMGMRQRFGTAWRPMEQGIVERSHQELQKILGMLLVDVLRSYQSEWTELLPVVEFLVYNTPGPHGFTPRDIDRRWSCAIPLEKELQPFQVLDFEPVTEHAKNLFKTYREIRAKVLGWYAATSEKRAELANRFRRNKTVEVGQKVVYRDPRAKAVGGRTAWKEPLSDPCVVEAVHGNKVHLRRSDGVLIQDAHLEDVLVVPDDARQLETRVPLEFEAPAVVQGDDGLDARRSIGQMWEGVDLLPTDEQVRRTGKLDKIVVGHHVAYALEQPGKVCAVGRVHTVTRASAEIVLHKHRPLADGR